MSYQRKCSLAIDSVRAACRLCEAVYETLVMRETLTKTDYSPVTVADYGVQALLSSELLAACPETPLVAEEDTGHLRDRAGADAQDRLLEVLAQVGRGMEREAMLAAIERGCYPGGGQGQFWALDPIDGTKGFLRGGQYAIALALIENGHVVLGVLGCPRLPVDVARPELGTGCIFLAVRGDGVVQTTLEGTGEQPIHVSAVQDPSQATLCESVESAHSDQDVSQRIAQELHVAVPSVRMDSQCKYAAIARGDAEIYLRLPTPASLATGYEEKIWDHAAGSLVATIAGGTVSDIDGQPLDFSQGRTLKKNRGVVVTNGQVHDATLRAIRDAYANAS